MAWCDWSRRWWRVIFNTSFGQLPACHPPQKVHTCHSPLADFSTPPPRNNRAANNLVSCRTLGRSFALSQLQKRTHYTRRSQRRRRRRRKKIIRHMPRAVKCEMWQSNQTEFVPRPEPAMTTLQIRYRLSYSPITNNLSQKKLSISVIDMFLTTAIETKGTANETRFLQRKNDPSEGRDSKRNEKISTANSEHQGPWNVSHTTASKKLWQIQKHEVKETSIFTARFTHTTLG